MNIITRSEQYVIGFLNIDAVIHKACILNFVFHAEDGIRDIGVTGVQTCALPDLMMMMIMMVIIMMVMVMMVMKKMEEMLNIMKAMMIKNDDHKKEEESDDDDDNVAIQLTG